MKVICKPCARPMVCQIVDVVCRWPNGWCYNADQYLCLECGGQTLVTGQQGYDAPPDLKATVLAMREGA